jgi:hypothetical protein
VVDLPPAQVRAALIGQGMTPERAGAVLAMRGTDAVALGMTVYPTVEKITGQAPRTYAAWVDAHIEAFR